MKQMAVKLMSFVGNTISKREKLITTKGSLLLKWLLTYGTVKYMVYTRSCCMDRMNKTENTTCCVMGE